MKALYIAFIHKCSNIFSSVKAHFIYNCLVVGMNNSPLLQFFLITRVHIRSQTIMYLHQLENFLEFKFNFVRFKKVSLRRSFNLRNNPLPKGMFQHVRKFLNISEKKYQRIIINLTPDILV